jgi:hypothetical protein
MARVTSVGRGKLKSPATTTTSWSAAMAARLRTVSSLIAGVDDLFWPLL